MTKAISGLSFDELLTKKNQSKEVRQKQRDNAIRAAKDKKKASEANKKANRAANKAAKAQVPKGGNKGRVPMKGGAKGGKR
jgi:large subunit ribosomal protein L24e